MRAYHNDPAVKAKYVKRFAAHRAADEVVQGRGYCYGRGCFVGCTLNEYRHESFPVELGWPVWLAYLADSIFERLPAGEAAQFGSDLLEAVPVGADLELARTRFLLLTQRRNLERLKLATDSYEIKCREVIGLLEKWQVEEEAKAKAEVEREGMGAWEAMEASEAEAPSQRAWEKAWEKAERTGWMIWKNQKVWSASTHVAYAASVTAWAENPRAEGMSVEIGAEAELQRDDLLAILRKCS